MTTLPDRLERDTHIELRGRDLEPSLRRLLLLSIAAASIAGLANVFGQRPETSIALGPAAVVTLDAPDGLRGGLIFQVRISVQARRALEKPALVFDPGWNGQISFIRK